MNGFIQEGKVRLLGVSSLERTKLAPEAPPIADILPGYDIDTWFSILAAKDRRKQHPTGERSSYSPMSSAS